MYILTNIDPFKRTVSRSYCSVLRGFTCIQWLAVHSYIHARRVTYLRNLRTIYNLIKSSLQGIMTCLSVNINYHWTQLLPNLNKTMCIMLNYYTGCVFAVFVQKLHKQVDGILYIGYRYVPRHVHAAV